MIKLMGNEWFIGLVIVILVGLVFTFSSCRNAGSAQEKKVSGCVKVIQDDTAITIKADGKNILSYYYAVHDVPEGIDPLYRRSGFIHPLWSPEGHILTAIQPKDHYHHYGIWAPWTLTHIEGREVDFWNLAKGQGTVRFVGVESIIAGGQGGGFRVRQEHVDFTVDKAGRVSIEEILDVRAWPETIEGRPVWIIDYVSQQRNVLDSPILLDAYRYGGGLAFRATAQWTKDTCTVLTSEGKTRENADGTRARWCDIRGTTGSENQTSGVVFFSHPSNHQHPEPMRVWPPDAVDGKGDLMFDYCPTRLQDWEFDPDQKYNFKYRMIVYDDKLDPKTINTLWDNYACSTKIKRLK